MRTGVKTAPVIDISVDRLAKSYGDGPPVLADLSFKVRQGEAVALVGANGTGKSTLLRCLMGLTLPSAGSLAVLGIDPAFAGRRELRALRAQTGLVSQKHNLVPRLSVLTNVIHGILGQRGGPTVWSQTFATDAIRMRAMAALGKVGLADLADRRADRLSGGQSQRVAIARALMAGPRFLIADEPCASLDPSAEEDVMDLFFRLVREEGVTVVFTSHNISHALKYGDRVLGLARGRLQLDAAAIDLGTADLRGLYD
ncbi:phosphonate ABC transporter ATP-binding protein [Actibacterium sp. 188UL27-1]|uniref:phosphonate ABC transporter ATP-binding protein n=1 Tax=Actibacterium sp. 188UL27-1 TaxID=2786961 RepID=UPI00195BDDA4|nr:ATP-binding cassette domain-containing protein [Actibacterium sp. 188UL27-1]MBM7068868.1 ATP-binding cassette domain-containing protein [Actibacterium sp. 188UL27-1]